MFWKNKPFLLLSLCNVYASAGDEIHEKALKVTVDPARQRMHAWCPFGENCHSVVDHSVTLATKGTPKKYKVSWMRKYRQHMGQINARLNGVNGLSNYTPVSNRLAL